MPLFSLDDVARAAKHMYQHMPATPQYSWPLINEAVGTEVWVKHENHTPAGAFKVRGGMTFMQWLRQSQPHCKGIITATRGNHGQSQARAATAAGLSSTILVPDGNSQEKNAAMAAFGAKVITAGADFDAAREQVAVMAQEQALFAVPPFHEQLVLGVSTYALELFQQLKDLDTVYVPIGCGSGICGLITIRDLLGLSTKIVGVVSTEAPAAKWSFESGKLQHSETANTFADGVAVRQVVPEAYEIYARGADRIVAVSDDEVANAIRVYYRCTHNVAEGAGATPLAALLQEVDEKKERYQGKKVGVILCGGNIDTDLFATILSGHTPRV